MVIGYKYVLLPSVFARGSNPAAWALMSTRVCIYIYVAIVRSPLGMQLPFKVNARVPSLRGMRMRACVTYTRTARRRRRAGAAGSPYSTGNRG